MVVVCIVNMMMGTSHQLMAYLIIYFLFIEWYWERRGTTSGPELLLEIGPPQLRVGLPAVGA